MPLPQIFSSPNFRLTALFSSGFAVSIILLFGFIYWQTSVVETRRVDSLLVRDATLMAQEAPSQLLESVNTRVAADFHRIIYASLFAADGRFISGNLPQLPVGIALDGLAHPTELEKLDATGGVVRESVRVVVRLLPTGEILVIGRSVDSLNDLKEVASSPKQGY